MIYGYGDELRVLNQQDLWKNGRESALCLFSAFWNVQMEQKKASMILREMYTKDQGLVLPR